MKLHQQLSFCHDLSADGESLNVFVDAPCVFDDIDTMSVDELIDDWEGFFDDILFVAFDEFSDGVSVDVSVGESDDESGGECVGAPAGLRQRCLS